MKIMLMLTVMAGLSLSLPAQDYSCEGYDMSLLRQGGSIRISAKGKNLIHKNKMVAQITSVDGKNEMLNEVGCLDIDFEKNILTGGSRLEAKDKTQLAGIKREVTFNPDGYSSDITVTAKENFNFMAVWGVYTETLYIPMKNIAGASIKVKKTDGAHQIMVVSPKKENWTLKDQYQKIELLFPGKTVTVIPGKDVVAMIRYWGENNIELYIRKEITKADLKVKKGTSFKLNYEVRINN